MRTGVYFYKFDTKSKPGKLVATGVRFETLEMDATDAQLDNTTFKLLCGDHPELNAVVNLREFKSMVNDNIP